MPKGNILWLKNISGPEAPHENAFLFVTRQGYFFSRRLLTFSARTKCETIAGMISLRKHHITVSFAKFDISFFVPTVSNAISSILSDAIGFTLSIVPSPNALCFTLIPTV